MKSPIRKKYLLLYITVAVLAAGGFSAVVFAYLTGQPKNLISIDSSDFYSKVSETIGNNAVLQKGTSITSSRGFSATFDDSTIRGRAQTTDESSTENNITGVEYEGDELKETRPYSMFIFEVKPVEQENDAFQLNARLSVITNIRSTFFSSRESQSQFAGKSKIDILVEDTVQKALAKAPNTTASAATDVNIAGVNYKKVTLTTTYNSLGVALPGTSEDIYMTVQNDRPYWARLSLKNQQNQDQANLLESIIASVKYSIPEGQEVAGESYKPTTASILTLPEGTSYVPKPIDSKTIMNVVAKNQPAVVRVGTAYCIDADLLKRDGSVGLTLTHACNGGIGSGTIVSSDGYIATNGHVTQFTDKDGLATWGQFAYNEGAVDQSFTSIRNFLNYLASVGSISPSVIDRFIAALKSKDDQAIGALYSLPDLIPAGAVSVKDRRATYAIQTSNEPLRLSITPGKDISYNYSSTILSAKHIDSNYDPDVDLSKGFGTSSDVSILKMEGSNFPIVTLGSISSISAGNQLTALGFPGFVDGGVNTKQQKTVPSVTQGNIIEIFSEPSVYKLIATTVPIAHGNSGGPAFNDQGEQVGLNTYGKAACEDEQCFGDGIARDVADYIALLKKNNITLNTNSPLTNRWTSGIEALSTGNYKKAVSEFDAVSSTYPANYLAASLSTFAASRIGGPDDISGQENVTIILIVVAVVLILAAVGTVILVIRLKKKNQDPPASPQAPTNPPAPTPPAAPIAPAAAAAQPAVQPTPVAPQPQAEPVTPAAPPTAPAPTPVAATPPATPAQPETPPNPWFTNQPPQPPQA